MKVNGGLLCQVSKKTKKSNGEELRSLDMKYYLAIGGLPSLVIL